MIHYKCKQCCFITRKEEKACPACGVEQLEPIAIVVHHNHSNK